MALIVGGVALRTYGGRDLLIACVDAFGGERVVLAGLGCEAHERLVRWSPAPDEDLLCGWGQVTIPLAAQPTARAGSPDSLPLMVRGATSSASLADPARFVEARVRQAGLGADCDRAAP